MFRVGLLMLIVWKLQVHQQPPCHYAMGLMALPQLITLLCALVSFTVLSYL